MFCKFFQCSGIAEIFPTSFGRKNVLNFFYLQSYFAKGFMSFRIQKVNSLIKEQIAEILTRELNLKSGVFLTIVKVDTTRDLRYTRIFISVFPEGDRKYVLTALKNEKINIQKILHNKLHLKIMPKVIFKLDTTEAEADEIEKILRKIKKEDN